MREVIIQLVTAFLGSLGFALLFQLKNRLLLAASLGGLINWGVYLLTAHFTGGAFIPCFISAAAAVMYCELTARLFKAPVTLFLVPAIIPSVPGGSLFYTMSNVVQKNWQEAKDFGLKTTEFALGIAAGVCLAVAVFGIVNTIVHNSRKD